MADRRMFTKKVTDDDHFMELSASAQALYLHLSMAADDDGFCNQISVAMFKAHASVQDLEALLEKRYIYQFDNGVIVIKHWRMANALRKDRYTPTAFQEELSKLAIKENGAYTWLPDGCQVVATRLPQDRLDKDSIEEDRLEEDIEPPKRRGGVFQRFASDDKELSSALKEFNEFRNRKKKPMTDEAKERLCRKLEKFPREEWIAIIHQSIDQGWTDIYPLKGAENKETEKSAPLNRNFKVSGDPDKWANDSFKSKIADLMGGEHGK